MVTIQVITVSAMSAGYSLYLNCLYKLIGIVFISFAFFPSLETAMMDVKFIIYNTCAILMAIHIPTGLNIFSCIFVKKSKPTLLANEIKAIAGIPINKIGFTIGKIIHCKQKIGVLIICFNSLLRKALLGLFCLHSLSFSSVFFFVFILFVLTTVPIAPFRYILDIIQPRVEELFEQIQHCVATSGYKNFPVVGVLTGGGSQMPGMTDQAVNILGLKEVRRGVVQRDLVTSDDDFFDPVYSTAMALAVYASDNAGYDDYARDSYNKGGSVFGKLGRMIKGLDIFGG